MKRIQAFKLFEEAPFDETSFGPTNPKNKLWLVGFNKIQQMQLKDIGADEVSTNKVVFKEEGYDIICKVEREEMEDGFDLFDQSDEQARVFDIEVIYQGAKPKQYFRVDTFPQLVDAIHKIVIMNKRKKQPVTKAKLIKMKSFENFQNLR